MKDMFAAYSKPSNECTATDTTQTSGASSWLQNESYVPLIPKPKDIPVESPSPAELLQPSDYSPSRKRSKKVKKEKSKKKKKEKSKERDEDDKHRKRKDEGEKPEPKEIVPIVPRGTVFSNGLQLRPSQAFYEDRKGDRNNLGFPNLYYKHVAR